MYIAVALLLVMAAPQSAPGESQKPSPFPEKNRQTRPLLSDRPDLVDLRPAVPAAPKPGRARASTKKAVPSPRSEPVAPIASADRMASVASNPSGEQAPGAQSGYAGFTGDAAPGARTASGEALNNDELTAAHPRYPLGTRVRVTNIANGRSVVVRINDRCKSGNKRIINVTRRAAEELGFVHAGTAHVRLEPVEDAAE